MASVTSWSGSSSGRERHPLLLFLFSFLSHDLPPQRSHTHRLFGLTLVLIEVWVPTFVKTYLGFLVTFFGRGLWLVFLGCLVLGPPAPDGVELFFFCAGICIIVVGVIFMILQFVSYFDSPKPVLENADEQAHPFSHL